MTRPSRLAATVLAASAAAAASPALAAGAADLGPAFANTIVSTYPDGRKARLWLNADATYTAKGRRGQASSGKWKIKGDKLCLTQRKPVPGPFSFCTPLKSGGVGTTWAAKAVTGEPVTIQVVAGR